MILIFTENSLKCIHTHNAYILQNRREAQTPRVVKWRKQRVFYKFFGPFFLYEPHTSAHFRKSFPAFPVYI